MKLTIRTIVKLTLLSLLGLILAAIASGFVYRAWRQRQTEASLVITAPNGTDESMFVPIAGTPEWITIRGQARRNPVILMFHGGPGVTNEGFIESFTAWEKSFTIVQWDQPGAGRTFEQAGRKHQGAAKGSDSYRGGRA